MSSTISQTNIDYQKDTNAKTNFNLTKEQITKYYANGFIFIPSLFELEELEPLRQAVEEPELWKEEIPHRYSNGHFNRLVLYSHLNNSFLGVLPRIARIVNAVEAILGEECSHFHSKLVPKDPYSQGRIDWHQDYWAWYHHGCLFPQQITCSIAVTENTIENGCMQFLEKSHLMGRLEHVKAGDTEAADPEKVQKALEILELFNCEMKIGDAIFMNSNLLHTSNANNTDKSRILFHCTYTTRWGSPYKEEFKKHHGYQPLKKLSDSTIKEGHYDGIFKEINFFPSENSEDKETGLVFRHGANK